MAGPLLKVGRDYMQQARAPRNQEAYARAWALCLTETEPHHVYRRPVSASQKGAWTGEFPVG